MIGTDEVFEIIRSSIPDLEVFGVRRIGLFGSYANGDPDEDSYIDILVEFNKGSETFDNLLNVHDILKRSFQKEIDIVTIDGLSPYIGPHILREVKFVEKAPA